MSKPKQCILLVIVPAVLFGVIQAVSALTIERHVTPAYVKDNPNRISVAAEKKGDGLIHFTITYFLPRPSYLVANTEVRDGDRVVFQNTSSAFVREKSATYYASVAPERVTDAKFDLFVGSFVESNGAPTPVPGGTDYRIQLSEFAKSIDTK